MDACQIVILRRADGAVDVGAPMKHKDLCYDILADARTVIERLRDQHFSPVVKQLGIVMDMRGVVDVAAPLPPRELCYVMLEQGRDVIERYNDDAAPPMRAFPAALMGT